MKAKDLRSLNGEELKNKMLDLKKELFNLRFQQASGEIKNTSRFREVKRAIARILTLVNEKRA